MPAPECPKELVNLIGQFKSIVSFRLHSHIIAAALDVPSIALVWDQKLRFYFEKIGHGERCMTIKQDSKEVISRLHRAEEEGYDRSLIERQKRYADNLLYLRFLGVQAPEDGLPSRHSTAQDDTVTNYHLQKLLEARTYLLRLLKER